MNSSKNYNAIPGATLTYSNGWLLSYGGAATDGKIVTIGGVVFTEKTTLGTTAGNFLIGANQTATATNLAAFINAPTTTNTTQRALTGESLRLFQSYGLSATSSAAVVTIYRTNGKPITLSLTTDDGQGTITSQYTSDPIPMDFQGRISFQMGASGRSSGNGVFTAEVSNDGTNWVAYNRLTTNATNTNAQTDVRVANYTVNSNVYSVATFPMTDVFSFCRFKVVVTTDGTYYCNVLNA